MISIDDFAKIELKVGKIVEIEDVPMARKPLYKLSVNIGGEMRTIVAGIKGHYDSDALMGKKIICVTNLEPKTVAGISSQGMLLAAESNGKLALLVPDSDIEEGALVH